MRKTFLVFFLATIFFGSALRAQNQTWRKLGQSGGIKEVKIAESSQKINAFKFELISLRDELAKAGINEKISLEINIKDKVVTLGSYQPLTTPQGIRWTSIPDLIECGSSMEPLPLTLDSSMEPLPARLILKNSAGQTKITWNIKLKWSRDNGTTLTPLKK